MGIYSDLERDFDFDIVDEFFSHYSIMCESAESLILNLRDEDLYKISLEQLFRIFHNIKSATGYLKITTINNIVSLVEEFLDDCRDEKGPASEEFISWFFIVIDQLVIFKEDLEKNRDHLSPIDKRILKLPAFV